MLLSKNLHQDISSEQILKIHPVFHFDCNLFQIIYNFELNLPGNKILLPGVVDSEGNNFIEIVPQKASMGYERI